MRILPDDSYIYRMIEAEVDRRILDQVKSKEFSENSWEDYLSKAENSGKLDMKRL